MNGDGDIDAQVKNIMQREGASYDAAISRIHRAEKLAKHIE
jgi:hypothetical protein